MEQRKIVIKEIARVIFGLFIYSFGVYMTIIANIGVNPWDVLALGVSSRTPLSYGLALSSMSVMILVVDVLMKEKIGWGTLMQIVCKLFHFEPRDVVHKGCIHTTKILLGK